MKPAIKNSVHGFLNATMKLNATEEKEAITHLTIENILPCNFEKHQAWT
jgi:hypothetical protein